MAKNKDKRILVTLEYRAGNNVYRYITTKNRQNTPDRLEIKKYCPFSRQHEVFKEIK